MPPCADAAIIPSTRASLAAAIADAAFSSSTLATTALSATLSAALSAAAFATATVHFARVVQAPPRDDHLLGRRMFGLLHVRMDFSVLCCWRWLGRRLVWRDAV